MIIFSLKNSAINSDSKFIRHIGKNVSSLANEQNNEAFLQLEKYIETHKYRFIILFEEYDRDKNKTECHAYFFVPDKPQCFYLIAGEKNQSGNLVLNASTIRFYFTSRSGLPSYRLDAKGVLDIVNNKTRDNIAIITPKK